MKLSLRLKLTLTFSIVFVVVTMLLLVFTVKSTKILMLSQVHRQLDSAVTQVKSTIGTVDKDDDAISDLQSQLAAAGLTMEYAKDPKTIAKPLGEDWKKRMIHSQGYVVEVGFPWYHDEQTLDWLALRYLLATLVIDGFFLIACWFLIGKVLEPIDRITAQAREAVVSTKPPHLEASSTDAELIELVDTLNGLLARTTNASKSVSQIYASISHELRTPLQALIGHIDLSLSRTRTSEEYQETLQTARDQTMRLKTIIEDILLLHRVQRMDGDLERISLRESVEDGIKLIHQSHPEWKGTIQLRAESDFSVYAMRTHLMAISNNLLENAILYGDHQKPVTIRIHRRGNQGCLEVENDLVQAHPDDSPAPILKHGHGLGLLIARTVCATYQWKIETNQSNTQFTALFEASVA